MIMMGLKFMDKRPFEKVFIHGLIRDLSGKKMSKSLGNVIDPVEVIDHVGADALRFSLTSLVTSGGQDLKLSEEKITEGRNFANKIWNVSRFVLMQGDITSDEIDVKHLSIADKWIMSRYNSTVDQITTLLDTFEFGEAARRMYEFIWSEFCDWYIEMAKMHMYQDTASKDNTLKVLRHILNGTLRLLHPFMPFETEEIFSYLSKDTIMLSDWPKSDKMLTDEQVEKKIGVVLEIVRAIRNIRAEMNVAQNKEISVIISAGTSCKDYIETIPYIKLLVKAENVEIIELLPEKPKQSATALVHSIEIYVPLEGLIDYEKEAERLKKEIDEIDGLINRTSEKLENENFVKRAKPELVLAEREKLASYQDKKNILKTRLSMLG